MILGFASGGLTPALILMSEVWGDEADVRHLRIHVRRLRQKIEADPDQPQHISTKTGIGYQPMVK